MTRLAAGLAPAAAAGPTVLPLWPEGVPGAKPELGPEDESVAVENSILFHQALTRNELPAEMYLFEHPRRAEEWLKARGLLDRSGWLGPT